MLPRLAGKGWEVVLPHPAAAPPPSPQVGRRVVPRSAGKWNPHASPLGGEGLGSCPSPPGGCAATLPTSGEAGSSPLGGKVESTCIPAWRGRAGKLSFPTRRLRRHPPHKWGGG